MKKINLIMNERKLNLLIELSKYEKKQGKQKKIN